MEKKKLIIILSIILIIFTITMIVIAIIKNRPQEIEEVVDHNYAVNDVIEQEEEEVEELNDSTTLYINNVEFTNINRMTNEQAADRTTMLNKLKTRVKYDEDEYGKIIDANISESTDDTHVYVEVTFKNKEIRSYICTYDNKNAHSFLRCVSVEEWDYIQSGANAG